MANAARAGPSAPTPSSKSSRRARPPALARYIAMSASRSSASGLSRVSVEMAMPMLAVDATSAAGARRLALDGRGDAIGQLNRLIGIVDVLAQHDELVAAEPGDRVARSQDALDPVRHLHQQGIALVVAVLVVDRFEAVEVAEQHRQRPARALAAGQCELQPVEQRRAVRHPGERVVLGLEGEASLVLGPLDGDRGQHRARLAQGHVEMVGGVRLPPLDQEHAEHPTGARRHDRRGDDRPRGHPFGGRPGPPGTAGRAGCRAPTTTSASRTARPAGLSEATASPSSIRWWSTSRLGAAARVRLRPSSPSVSTAPSGALGAQLEQPGHRIEGLGQRRAAGDELEDAGLTTRQQPDAATAERTEERFTDQAHQRQDLFLGGRRHPVLPDDAGDAGEIDAAAEAHPQERQVPAVEQRRPFGFRLLGQVVDRADEDVGLTFELPQRPVDVVHRNRVGLGTAGREARSPPLVGEPQRRAVGVRARR